MKKKITSKKPIEGLKLGRYYNPAGKLAHTIREIKEDVVCFTDHNQGMTDEGFNEDPSDTIGVEFKNYENWFSDYTHESDFCRTIEEVLEFSEKLNELIPSNTVTQIKVNGLKLTEIKKLCEQENGFFF